MKSPRWFLHPLLIFILSILALGTSLFLYIHWYIEASAGIRSAVQRLNLETEQVLAVDTWMVIIVLSVLVGVILIGILMIYVYSQKALQLSRLQNNFINNFTHELKTPVTSLKLFLQTFTKHQLPRADQLKYIQFMLTDVGRLTETIDRILNLAKIESKSYAHEFREVDLVAAIQNFFKDSEHLFSQCRVVIHPPAEPLPHFRLNLSLFEMLLMNLGTNAVKYNQAEDPQIDIRFESGPRNLQVHFADNGIGLEQKEIRKIFRKFYQIGRADDRSAIGSGLGLYLAQTVANIHKWKIKVFSAGRGKGATFTVTLPYRGAV
ncbi:MAG: HAMP domain-containing sensor histidine kinase [Desulfobacterales bacterium]